MIRSLRVWPLLFMGLFLGGVSQKALATPAFAKKENKPCVYCHIVPGGPRNFRGLYYAAHNHSFADFDNEYEAKLAGVSPDAMGPDAKPTVAGYPNVQVNVPPVLRFVMKDIDGNPINLARYMGKVILIVNTASLCGNTPQYAALEQLYEKYKDKGFVILGFPSNDFGHQEPGDNKQIKEFCTSKYHVTFPIFSKIDVKGDNQAPLYKFLTDKQTDPKFGGPIEWNFAKFLIGRNGEIVARFPAGMSPAKPEVVAAIEHQLEQPSPSEKADSDSN